MIHEAKILNFAKFRGIQSVSNISQLYKWTKLLGAGSFGQVHEALNLKANVSCAMKIMSKRKVCKDRLTKNLVKKELSVL